MENRSRKRDESPYRAPAQSPFKDREPDPSKEGRGSFLLTPSGLVIILGTVIALLWVMVELTCS